MQYDPTQANAHLIQCDKDGLWCDSVILDAIDTTSKKGNAMIEAAFKIYDNQGKQPTIKHYFVSNYPGMFKKLCAALGLNYESGNVPAESLKGKNIKVLIKIQEDETGQFGDKNVVAAFAAHSVAPKSTAPSLDDPHAFNENDPALKDSEIPF